MLRNFYNTFVNCFKIPELSSRIFFTLGLLAVGQVLGFVRLPGIDGDVLARNFANSQNSGGMLALYNTFAGGAFDRCAVDALSIMPYISATIILQLLTAVWPRLSKLAREEGGRTKIVQYGRYLTVLLCIGQGLYFAHTWLAPETAFSGFQGQLVMFDNVFVYYFVAVTVMTAGTMLLMWIGEQITERGIGNGVSLVITIGILARLPNAAQGALDMFSTHGGTTERTHHLGTALVLLILMVFVIGGVIAITQAQRKIPVQYAQRAVGRKMYSGGTSFMPLRVNYSGVMPIIFAQSILMFPQPLLRNLENWITAPSLNFLKQFCLWADIQLTYGS